MSHQVDQADRRDQTMPTGKWAFDENVTDVFDDMLRRSIPQYDVMRDAVSAIARRYRVFNGTIVDLGCSRGEALAPLVAAYDRSNYFVGLEISEPMIEAARARFRDHYTVNIKKHDLRQGVPEDLSPCVVLSVLTLQFTPIEYRQAIIQSIYDAMPIGGAFILVEKILGSTGVLDALMVETYYDMKRANGYSEDAIQRKRLSLEGVLVPVTAKWNEDLLHGAGFRVVDCFWRWMNFAGWVAVKG